MCYILSQKRNNFNDIPQQAKILIHILSPIYQNYKTYHVIREFFVLTFIKICKLNAIEISKLTKHEPCIY